jgi:hypothetical protein
MKLKNDHIILLLTGVAILAILYAYKMNLQNRKEGFAFKDWGTDITSALRDYSLWITLGLLAVIIILFVVINAISKKSSNKNNSNSTPKGV